MSQATNSSNSSAVLNGYNLTAASPLPGPGPGPLPASAPAEAPQSGVQANKSGAPSGRRLLGSIYSSRASIVQQMWPAWQQHLFDWSVGPDKGNQLHTPGLSAPQTKQAQHAQQAESSQLLLQAAWATQAQQAQHALPWYTQQPYNRIKAMLKAAIDACQSYTAAAIRAIQDQAEETAGRCSSARQRRVLTAGSDDGVDLDITVNVPTGQSGSAAQSSIEGPAFGPALQQSLTNAGMQSDLPATCVFRDMLCSLLKLVLCTALRYYAAKLAVSNAQITSPCLTNSCCPDAVAPIFQHIVSVH